jgi:hypothetical protein
MATGDPIVTSEYCYTWFSDCPYRGKCTDNRVKCGTCANNPKKSYYVLEVPYYPYWPYWIPTVNPAWYPTPVWVPGGTCGTANDTESHYQTT